MAPGAEGDALAIISDDANHPGEASANDPRLPVPRHRAGRPHALRPRPGRGLLFPRARAATTTTWTSGARARRRCVIRNNIFDLPEHDDRDQSDPMLGPHRGQPHRGQRRPRHGPARQGLAHRDQQRHHRLRQRRDRGRELVYGDPDQQHDRPLRPGRASVRPRPLGPAVPPQSRRRHGHPGQLHHLGLPADDHPGRHLEHADRRPRLARHDPAQRHPARPPGDLRLRLSSPPSSGARGTSTPIRSSWTRPRAICISRPARRRSMRPAPKRPPIPTSTATRVLTAKPLTWARTSMRPERAKVRCVILLMTSDTHSEGPIWGMGSVILRRSRRIWPPNRRFLSLAAQILRCAQDDRISAATQN